ncbi:recombinase family protein [Streptomyces sp. NPDC087228]|uniref:recombinase family protein n=1 Tax=Streptomyces sp. NPDC087228 TaxID=3365772 RepID=UPI0038058C43
MKRLGRDAAELTALADHLTAHGLVLEMLAGPLPGIYDPTGAAPLLFAFFATMAETERENIRESTLEGLDTVARKGKHGGRPPVVTDDMLHTVLPRRANGEPIEQIQPDLIIPTGKRKGRNPSVASIYRALAEHAKREAYPEAVEQAHADFAALQAGELPGPAADRTVTHFRLQDHSVAPFGLTSEIPRKRLLSPSSVDPESGQGVKRSGRRTDPWRNTGKGASSSRCRR